MLNPEMESEQTYPLDPEKVYFSMDELTLDTDEGPKTLRMGAWLNYDPVRIHRMIIKDKTLKVDAKGQARVTLQPMGGLVLVE